MLLTDRSIMLGSGCWGFIIEALLKTSKATSVLLVALFDLLFSAFMAQGLNLNLHHVTTYRVGSKRMGADHD
ncbi:hypothetical protein ACFL2V_18225 [Pseudomonadota bacterium]